VPIGQTLTADTQTGELRFAGPQADACGTVAGLAPDKSACGKLAFWPQEAVGPHFGNAFLRPYPDW